MSNQPKMSALSKMWDGLGFQETGENTHLYQCCVLFPGRRRFLSNCRGKTNHGHMGCAWDSLSPLLVEEKAIMGTWACACDSFSPCLSRKRQSWEYGHALAIPFSPCLSRKRQSWGACDSLFPLPVEEKAIVGCLRFAFPPASRGTGLDGPSEARSLRLPKAFMKCLEPQRLRKRSKLSFPFACRGKGLLQISGGPQADPPRFAF